MGYIRPSETKRDNKEGGGAHACPIKKIHFINLLKVKYDKRFKGEKHNNVEKNNIKLTEYNGGLELTCDY